MEGVHKRRQNCLARSTDMQLVLKRGVLWLVPLALSVRSILCKLLDRSSGSG